MADQKAIAFYKRELAHTDAPIQAAVASIVEEAEATHGHYTMQTAIAVLIVDRRIRGILSHDEATRIFARLIK